MRIDKKAYQEFKKKYEKMTYFGEPISVPMTLTDENDEEFQINDNFLPVYDCDGYFWAMDFGNKYVDSYGTPYDKMSCRPVEELPENKGYNDKKIEGIINSLEAWINDLGIDFVLDLIEEAQIRGEK